MRVDDLDMVLPQVSGQEGHNPHGAVPTLVDDRDLDAEPSQLTGQPSFIQQDSAQVHVRSLDQVRCHRRHLDLRAGPQVAGHDVADP